MFLDKDDWDRINKTWSESFGDMELIEERPRQDQMIVTGTAREIVARNRPKPAEQQPKGKKPSNAECRVGFDYLRRGKTTMRAQFFITEDSAISGTYGFWAPKRAIVKDHGDRVEIADWCDITVVEFSSN